MKDINFVIINSKMNHALLLRSELKSHVSFEVFQDTEEEDVWNKLQGGKDDIYVYDRCGRLSYYLPYPLSAMNSADNLVPKAVVSAYVDNPCGDTCEENETIDEVTSENSTIPYDVSNTTTTEFEYSPTNETNNDVILSNNTESLNSNNTIDYVDYESTNENEIPSGAGNRTNSILNFFFDSPRKNNLTLETINDTLNISNSQMLENTTSYMNGSETRETYFDTTIFEPVSTTPTPTKQTSKKKRKNNRCKEADFQVCKDFSKRRLLRIQACCMFGGNNYKTTCRSFTSKRCKKMQTVIKCCIKTAFTEKITTEMTNTEIETTSLVSNVMCCKNEPGGRVCNVSLTGKCKAYEDLRTFTDATEVNTGATIQIRTESSM